MPESYGKCDVCGKPIWQSESIGFADVSGYCLNPHLCEEREKQRKEKENRDAPSD